MAKNGKITGAAIGMAAITMLVIMSACKPRECAAPADNSRGSSADKSTGTGAAPQAPAAAAPHREGPGGPGGKALPKLVPIKSFSERSTERLDFFKSTAPAPGEISGSSMTAKNRTAPDTVPPHPVIQPPAPVPAQKPAAN